MINTPNTAQLLRACIKDLRESVLPALDDDAMAVKLETILIVLHTCMQRAENERRWMAEEADAIIGVAREAAEKLPKADALKEALAALSDDEDIPARYEHCSEILSCLAEAAIASGDGDLGGRVRALFEQRIDHETDMIGKDFKAPGRA